MANARNITVLGTLITVPQIYDGKYCFYVAAQYGDKNDMFYCTTRNTNLDISGFQVGTGIFVAGDLKTMNYKDQNGIDRLFPEIEVGTVQVSPIGVKTGFNYNSAFVSGRLTRDAEVREDPNDENRSRATFSLAVNASTRDGKTEYFNITVWGKSSKYIANSMQYGRFLKGCTCWASGPVKNNKYTGRDGMERDSIQIYAYRMESDRLAEQRPAQNAQGSGQQPPQTARQAQMRQAMPQAPAQQVMPQAPVQQTVPQMPQAPVQQTVPQMPQAPAQQTVPQMPQTPVQQTVPQMPQTPVQQTVPQMPQTPVQQTVPQMPQAPVQQMPPQMTPQQPMQQDPSFAQQMTPPVQQAPQNDVRKGLRPMENYNGFVPEPEDDGGFKPASFQP